MRILVTGVRVELLLEQQAVDAGWAVDGVDLDLYQETSADVVPVAVGDGSPALADFRELRVEDLAGFDAVVHLAAISSDAACDLARRPVRPAQRLRRRRPRPARQEGRRGRLRSCSPPAAASTAPHRTALDRAVAAARRSPPMRARSSRRGGHPSRGLLDVPPTILRFATLYGLSPNLRSDLVVNTMVASAGDDRQINLHGSGEQSRPLLHVQRRRLTILDAEVRRGRMRGQVFNVTDESTGYSIARSPTWYGDGYPEAASCTIPRATDRRHYRSRTAPAGTEYWRRPSIRLEDGLAEVADGLAAHLATSRIGTARATGRGGCATYWNEETSAMTSAGAVRTTGGPGQHPAALRRPAVRDPDASHPVGAGTDPPRLGARRRQRHREQHAHA